MRSQVMLILLEQDFDAGVILELDVIRIFLYDFETKMIAIPSECIVEVTDGNG